MQRKARSRSDAPRLTVAFGTTLTIIGTIGGINCTTTGSVVIGNGYIGAIITAGIAIGTGVRISVGTVGGVGSTLLPYRTSR